jgi:hypothetical protein
MNINRRLLPPLGVVLFVLVASCDDNPTRPTPTPNLTPGTPAVTVLSIRIEAPTSVAPGSSAPVVVNATKSDGTTADVTSLVKWSTSSTRPLEVADGMVRGKEPGEVQIWAFYLNRSASTSILVLPEGTFKLAGTVTDGGVGLDGVTVAVIGGTGEGLSAVTDLSGSYRLYGVAGSVRLHAKKLGYENQTEALEVTTHRTANIAMSFGGERPRLAGTYEMTVTAASRCSSLTPAARTRSYTADIQQDGPRLSVVVTGADFIVTNGFGDRFQGTVIGDRVTFEPGIDYYYYYWSYLGQSALVERFPPTALVINGMVSARQTATGLAGQLSGTIGLTRTATPPFTSLASGCYAGTHDFVMTRR